MGLKVLQVLIDTISAGLSEERDSVEYTIELFLIQYGFINKTPRGRTLALNALKHLNINIKLQSIYMISDTDSDIKIAKNFSVKSIAASYSGY